MADVQWIKIYTNMFDTSRKIKKIELMPQGDTILIIWFKLLILAAKVNDSGAVYISKTIPYEIEDLAEEFRKSKKIIQKSLEIFENFEMIERINGFIFISSWEEYQNVDGMERIREQNRERKRHQRERQRQSKLGDLSRDDNVGESDLSRDSHATESEMSRDSHAARIRNKNLDIRKEETILTDGKEEKTTTTTTYSFSPGASARGNDFYESAEYGAFEITVIKYFDKHGYESSPLDFIAYNKARDWRGIGGEDVIENFDTYADNWERIQHIKNENY